MYPLHTFWHARVVQCAIPAVLEKQPPRRCGWWRLWDRRAALPHSPPTRGRSSADVWMPEHIPLHEKDRRQRFSPPFSAHKGVRAHWQAEAR